jgi:kynurenine formamidase
LIDLSHPVEDGVETYPGLPRPIISDYISFEESRPHIAPGRQFHADLITVLGGSATYMDAPLHFYPGGHDIAAYPLEQLVDRPAVVVPAPHGRKEYQPSDFAGLHDLKGHAVLLATGWDRNWKTPAYPHNSPYLGPDAAHFLVHAQVAMVGIDTVLIDNPDDPNPRPIREAHHSLLGAGIAIIENMARLTSLPRSGARVTAVPSGVRDASNFPVRAFARVG